MTAKTSITIDDFVKRIHTQAGIEVYAWGGGRLDYNDVILAERGFLSYVRGLHNLLSPPLSQERTFFVQIKNLILSAGGPNIWPDNAWTDREMPITFGKYTPNEVVGTQEIVGTRYEHRTDVSLKGKFKGVLGLSNTIETPINYTTNRPVRAIVDKRSSDLIPNGSAQDAYFLNILLRSHHTDSSNRGSGPIAYTIVGDRNLIELAFNYLHQNNDPGIHLDFAKRVLSKDIFPNVYNNLLPHARIASSAFIKIG